MEICLMILYLGDRVLEWNGVLLTGKTFEEVEQVIAASRGEIEVVVARLLIFYTLSYTLLAISLEISFILIFYNYLIKQFSV